MPYTKKPCFDSDLTALSAFKKRRWHRHHAALDGKQGIWLWCWVCIGRPRWQWVKTGEIASDKVRRGAGFWLWKIDWFIPIRGRRPWQTWRPWQIDTIKVWLIKVRVLLFSNITRFSCAYTLLKNILLKCIEIFWIALIYMARAMMALWNMPYQKYFIKLYWNILNRPYIYEHGQSVQNIL